jgi:hypothetical protein
MARRIGLSDVWSLTPREWYRALVAWLDLEDRVSNRETRQAWTTATLQRLRDIPPLAELLIGEVGEVGHTTRQTVAEQRLVLEAISRTYGLQMRKVVKSRGC